MVLNGSIRERVWQMLSCGGYSRSRKVSSDGCEALYTKAGIPFFPAARRFYERCGGLFSDCEIIFETGSDSREFYFYLYPDMGEDAAVELYKAYYDEGTSAGKRICEDALAAKAAAGTEVSPVGIIGYYYPATVYAAENGILYCVHEYESDVRVFADVEEILADELQVHRPIRIERRR